VGYVKLGLGRGWYICQDLFMKRRAYRHGRLCPRVETALRLIVAVEGVEKGGGREELRFRYICCGQ
jgi:hypothetical protein